MCASRRPSLDDVPGEDLPQLRWKVRDAVLASVWAFSSSDSSRSTQEVHVTEFEPDDLAAAEAGKKHEADDREASSREER